jgi:nitrous oxide reductase
MIKIYRVVLTDGNKWVVRATSKAQARSAAMVKCKDLDNFGVHIDKIEEVKDPDRV